MATAIKLLLIALSQLPIFVAYTAHPQQIKQQPVTAALLAIIYEITILISKKVWEKKLEGRAIQAAGYGILTLYNWLVTWVKNPAPGIRRRYNKQIKLEHEIFNVRGL
jgi:hypothetical protein